jgi:hypothetical protein
MHLIYYTRTGLVKSQEFLYNEEFGSFDCVPTEYYFIKGLVAGSKYLNSFTVNNILQNFLSPLERHFLTCKYLYFHELDLSMFRSEYEIIQLSSDEVKIYY